jgi:hypothetical protein
MAGGLGAGLFQAFLDWIYSSGDISVPGDFHSRCSKITDMLDNDVSGVINTLLNYSINSASEANFRIETSNETLQKLLNLWLQKINLNISGIPTGLQPLSKEYYKERWKGSSFCVLRAKDWEKISVDNVSIDVPTTMWFVNGASLYVKRPTDIIYKLGSDKYFLDAVNKNAIPESKLEELIIQKPYNRWFDQYPTPYLIKNGVFKNWLAMKVLQDKSDEVISKVLPYLFIIKRGSEELTKADITFDDKDLGGIIANLTKELEKYKNEKGRTPTTGQSYDAQFEHLIPDLSKMVGEELYRQGYRAILSGLGFIDVIQGVSSTRKESVLNPKPFIAEVNNGVGGFKEILLELIYKIIAKNKEAHKKFFNDNNKIEIVNNPLRVNVDEIIDQLRSGFVYGASSIQTYQEVLGLNPQTERERRKKELLNGDEKLFFPHLIQNQENLPDREKITPVTKKEIEKDKEQETVPAEAGKVISEPIDKNLEIAPYTKEKYPDYLKDYPEGARDVWIEVFNKTLKDGKGEDKAFPYAWTALKRWMKKHGYKKVNDKWVKE